MQPVDYVGGAVASRGRAERPVPDQMEQALDQYVFSLSRISSLARRID